jgi:DNA-binding transcriptional ArsR family regulator
MQNTNLLEEVSQLHADICSALADHNRILIIYALADKPRNVGDLAQEMGISQPAASRHLKILRERGLVSPVRQGANVEYHLTDQRLIQALDLLRDLLRDRLNRHADMMKIEAP